MKSTYKLFGTYWDGICLSESEAMAINDLQTDNLPDNVISFKKLLTVESQNDFEYATSSLKVDAPLAICVDYWPESSNPVLCLFLEKRLGQMITLLSKKYPNVHCIIV